MTRPSVDDLPRTSLRRFNYAICLGAVMVVMGLTAGCIPWLVHIPPAYGYSTGVRLATALVCGLPGLVILSTAVVVRHRAKTLFRTIENQARRRQ
jgi:hypothetical protein